MTPWHDLAIRTMLTLPCAAIGAVMYLRGTNCIRQKIHGGLLNLVLMTYGSIFSIILVVTPFIYLITTAQGMVLGGDGLLFLGATGLAWITSMGIILSIVLSHGQNPIVISKGNIDAVANTKYLIQTINDASSNTQAIIASCILPAMHFIALEYHHVVLNRLYVVFITQNMICGAKVRDSVSSPIIVTEQWYDPYFYPDLTRLRECAGIDLESEKFLNLNGENFQIPRSRVDRVDFNSERKWGMGYVPYSGRIVIDLKDGATKELILLGAQDGASLASSITASLSLQ